MPEQRMTPSFIGLKAFFGVLLVSAGLMGMGVSGAQAADESVYTARMVPVDERASNEVAAKNVGVEKAKETGLRMVMERLTRTADHGRLPTVGADSIETYVRDIAFASEKFGGGHYLAKVNVRYWEDAVQTLLKSNNIPFTDLRSGPVLVVPVLNLSGRYVLWDERNDWLAAWARSGDQSVLVPVKVPLGDLADVSDINADEAIAPEATKLAKIASRYGANAALVAVATPVGDGPDMTVNVTYAVIGGGWSGDSVFLSASLPDGEDGSPIFDPEKGTARAQVLSEAALAVQKSIEASWKDANVIDQAVSGTHLSINVPLTGISDWVRVQENLSGLTSVRSVDIVSLTTSQALLDLDLVGRIDQLQTALESRRMSLEYTQESGWVLHPGTG